MKHYQKNNGFTLIELLVVVLIISILSAIALPQYELAVKKSRFAQLQVAARALKSGMELSYLENSAYPTSLSDLSIQPPSGWHISDDGTKWRNTDWTKFCTSNSDIVWCGDYALDGVQFTLSLDYRAIPSGYSSSCCWTASNPSKLERFCKAMGGVQVSPSSSCWQL